MCGCPSAALQRGGGHRDDGEGTIGEGTVGEAGNDATAQSDARDSGASRRGTAS